MISDNLDNKLSKKNKDDEKRKISPPANDEDEETYMYDVRKPMAFINEGKYGVFDITKQTGINTAKSVFDKGSIFNSKLK